MLSDLFTHTNHWHLGTAHLQSDAPILPCVPCVQPFLPPLAISRCSRDLFWRLTVVIFVLRVFLVSCTTTLCIAFHILDFLGLDVCISILAITDSNCSLAESRDYGYVLCSLILCMATSSIMYYILISSVTKKRQEKEPNINSAHFVLLPSYSWLEPQHSRKAPATVTVACNYRSHGTRLIRFAVTGSRLTELWQH